MLAPGSTGSNEVYSGRDNSGSAYVLPDNAPDTFETFDAALQRAAAERKAQALIQRKTMDDALKAGSDYGTAWERDQPILAQKYNDLHNKYVDAYQQWEKAGRKKELDPTNPASEVYRALKTEEYALKSDINLSKQQKGFWEEGYKKKLGAPEDKYDWRGDEYANMPIAERAKFNLGELLSERYDMPKALQERTKEVKDMKPDEKGSYYWDQKNDLNVETLTKSFPMIRRMGEAQRFIDRSPQHAKHYQNKFQSLPEAEQQKLQKEAESINAQAQKKGIPSNVTPLTILSYKDVEPQYAEGTKYDVSQTSEWKSDSKSGGGGQAKKYVFTWDQNKGYTQNMAKDGETPNPQDGWTAHSLHIQSRNPGTIPLLKIDASKARNRGANSPAKKGIINIQPHSVALFPVINGKRFVGDQATAEKAIREAKAKGQKIDWQYYVLGERMDQQKVKKTSETTGLATDDTEEGAEPSQELMAKEELWVPYEEVKKDMVAKFGFDEKELEVRKQQTSDMYKTKPTPPPFTKSAKQSTSGSTKPIFLKSAKKK